MSAAGGDAEPGSRRRRIEEQTMQEEPATEAQQARALTEIEHDEERWTKFIFFGLFVIMICAIVALATYAALT